MNNYIVLDGCKYVTPFGRWTPIIDKPATARIDLTGGLDVTYGPSTWQKWQGVIEVPAEPPSSDWGDPDNLRVTLAKRSAVLFYDHYGRSYNVHCLGPFPEMSMTPAWDGASNVLFIQLSLVGIFITSYQLTLGKYGSGDDIVASPTHSEGCEEGYYVIGESISLSGGVAGEGYEITGWEGTDDDGLTTGTNTATMPAAALAVNIIYDPVLVCYALTLGHTGNGADPVADIANSEGCDPGSYIEGEVLALTGATPDEGWEVGGWTGSDNDEHTGEANALTMPAEAHEVLVNYIEIPE